MERVNLGFYVKVLKAVSSECEFTHYESHLAKLKGLEEAMHRSRLKLEQSFEDPNLSRGDLNLLENTLLNIVRATAFQRKRILSALLQDIQDSLQPYLSKQSSRRLSLRKASAKLRTLYKRLLVDFPDESCAQAVVLLGVITQVLALIHTLLQGETAVSAAQPAVILASPA